MILSHSHSGVPSTNLPVSPAAPRPLGTLDLIAFGTRSMWQHRVLALIFLSAALLQGAMQGLVVWAFRGVLLSFDEAAAVSTADLARAGLVILGLWLLRSLSNYGGAMAQARLSARVEINLMRKVLAKLLRLSMRFFEQKSQGDLVMSLYQDVRQVREIIWHLASFVLSSARLLGLGTVAWFISPKLAIVGFIALPLGMLPAHFFGRRITRVARSERETSATLHDTYLEVSSGIRIIKTSRAEDRVLKRARQLGRQLYHQAVRRAESRNMARFLIESVSGLGMIAILVLGANDVALNRIDWPELLALLIAMIAVNTPVLMLLKVHADFRFAIPRLERVNELLDAPIELADIPNPTRMHQAPATIELRDVSFEYLCGEPVLDAVSATFHRGETIGVCGPSGSGKSTLIALMLRLYEPTGGKILYDGVDLHDLKHADLLDKCAMVTQEPMLFLDTVANNIRWARPDASMEEVIAAATSARIHNEIMHMRHGYETQLGRRKGGRGLSVGQKQRICIAAALLKNAPLLFLDEATSNLDYVSERMVQGAIERLMKGRTTFIVAHRLSTLRHVDRILVLERGQIVGLGAHRELIETCPTYQESWRHQGDTEPHAVPIAGE